MGDVVAGFEFEELFEGECLVGVAQVADGVFVIAFKDFVVGKADNVLVVVDKAVVGLALEELDILDEVVVVNALSVGKGYGIDGGGVADKDFFEAVLLLVVCHGDEDAVAAVAILGEGVHEQAELLVESRLGLRMGLHSGGVGEIAAVALLNDAAAQEGLEELVGGAIVLGILPGVGKEGLDGFADEHEPLHPHQVVAAEVVQQGHFFLDGDGVQRTPLHVGQHADGVVLLDRKLRHRVEGAEGFDCVVEELDAERIFVGKGEDIHYSSAHGILAGFNHEIDALEAIVLKHVDDKVYLHLSAFGNAEGVACEGARRDDLFIECFGVGDHEQAASGVELLDDFATLEDVGVVGAEKVTPVILNLGRPVGVGRGVAPTGFAV